jgi:hypothetical protein
MNSVFRSARRFRAVVLFCVALSAVLLGAAPAAASSSPAVAPPSATYWTAFWHFVESSITTQQTMVQVGFVGMCLGLYIIIWKKRA